MPSDVLEQIPFNHAGGKAHNPEAEGPLSIGNKHYHISNGYLVPYYLRDNAEPLERRSEELVVDRCRKFFQMAEQDIELVWTREAIENQKKRLEAAQTPREQAAESRILVGAMVHRLERLARVFLQRGSSEGTRIDLTEEQQAGVDSILREIDAQSIRERLEKLNLTDTQKAALEIEFKGDDAESMKKKLEPLQREFEDLYVFLTYEPPMGHADLTRNVRLRDLATDHDGLLLDLIREAGKGFNLDNKSAERTTYNHIVTKIGLAMHNIDELHEGILRAVKVNNAMPILRAAQREKHGEESYFDMLQEFVDLARARTGIKSEDDKDFAPILARLGVLEEKLHKTHSAMRFAARAEHDEAAQSVRDLLDQGIKLIMRCAEARTPVNEYSPNTFGLEGLSTAEKRALSSTGRFEQRITTLAASMQQDAAARRA